MVDSTCCGALLSAMWLAQVGLRGGKRRAPWSDGGWCDREGLRTPSGRALTDEWWRNVLANPTNAGLVGYHRKRGGTELHKAAFRDSSHGR